ncbi:PAS domain-containing protein [Oscillochloris sp. ZM17-4]|uniref:two-component system sensor histidine kinase NtrB n=1 Tax=Oscillochloris sp. ZM17-4 TaxID=2866714 RepID=UPI001C72C335|nr:PAS domain-containing protein [Oscillochloris sp. ZM17-4]
MAEIDASLRYAAVYSPGVLLGGREVVGRTHDEIYGPQGAPLMDMARRALASGEAQVGPLVLDTGATHHMEVRVTPMRRPDGTTSLSLLATERVQIDAQMVERERFAATGRLAATVAHEVNTPLQAIESCLHLAGRVDDEAERARYLRLAREEIKRVGYTLRQLLDLYRPSAAPTHLDINGLIERVLILTGNSLARRSIQIERDLSPDLPLVVGRADEITQVLINLVFNAMHAMPRGGRIRLESGRAIGPDSQAMLVIRVRDNGLGIAPELHQQIFEPFFTTNPDGTGLGLAICRRIIEGYGGALRVESAPDAGSCFIVEIPAAEKGAGPGKP